MQFSILLIPKRWGLEIRLADFAGFRYWAPTLGEVKHCAHQAIYDAAARLARIGEPMWLPLGYDMDRLAVSESGSFWATMDVTMEHLFCGRSEPHVGYRERHEIRQLLG